MCIFSLSFSIFFVRLRFNIAVGLDRPRTETKSSSKLAFPGTLGELGLAAESLPFLAAVPLPRWLSA